MARHFQRALTSGAAALLAAVLLVSTTQRTPAAPAPLIVDGVEIADGPTIDAARREGSILLYSTYEPIGLRAILDRFTADTGIRADAMRLISEPMYERATAEYTAHRLPADWVDTSDMTLTQQLADKGILRPYRVRDFGGLETSLRDDGGRWYSVIRGVMAIAVNTAIVKPGDMPKSWNDLTDPRWKGRLGLTNIEAGGTAYTPYFFLRQRFGIAYWKRLAALEPRIEPAATPVVNDLARGDTSIALSGIDMTLNGIQQGAPLKSIIPIEGVPAYSVAGGITSTAPHPHAAEVFLEWITSKRGSAAVALRAYGITRNAPAPTFGGLNLPPESALYNIRPSDYLSTRAAYVRDWHEIFGTR